MRDYIGQIVDIVIDRPLGSTHPKGDMIYPLNYGYIPHTVSGDGMEIDVYILGEGTPLTTYRGKVIAVIEREDDMEDKLVVYNGDTPLTPSDIMDKVAFQEQYFHSKVIMN